MTAIGLWSRRSCASARCAYRYPGSDLAEPVPDQATDVQQIERSGIAQIENSSDAHVHAPFVNFPAAQSDRLLWRPARIPASRPRTAPSAIGTPGGAVAGCATGVLLQFPEPGWQRIVNRPREDGVSIDQVVWRSEPDSSVESAVLLQTASSGSEVAALSYSRKVAPIIWATASRAR